MDLTKNPKDALKGAKNALPDVSAVPTREQIIAKVPSLSFPGAVTSDLMSIAFCKHSQHSPLCLCAPPSATAMYSVCERFEGQSNVQ